MSFANLKGLSFMVNRINAGFSRRRVKLTQQNMTAASAGSHVVITMPSGLVDTQSLSLHGLLTTTAAATKFAAPQSIEHCVDSMWLEIGGQQISQPFRYNDVHHIFESFQAGDKTRMRNVIKSWTAEDAATGVATAPAANVTAKPFAIHNIVPFSSMSPRYIDFSLMGDVRLHIRLATNHEALVFSDSAAAGAYSWSDIYMNADLIDMPREYFDAVSARLGSGGFIELPFAQWYDITGPSQSINNAQVSAQISSQSVDAVLATARITTLYNSAGGAVADLKSRASKHYAFGTANLTGVRVYLNNVSYPEYGTVTNAEAFVSAESLMTGLNDTVAQPANALSSLDNFTASHYIAATRLNYADQGDGKVISGINATSAPLQIKAVFEGSSDTIYPQLFVATTASLLVYANRQVTVRY